MYKTTSSAMSLELILVLLLLVSSSQIISLTRCHSMVAFPKLEPTANSNYEQPDTNQGAPDSDYLAQEQRLALQIITTDLGMPTNASRDKNRESGINLMAKESATQADIQRQGLGAISFDDQYRLMTSQLESSSAQRQISEKFQPSIRVNSNQNHLIPKRIVIKLNTNSSEPSAPASLTIGFSPNVHMTSDLAEAPASNSRPTQGRSFQQAVKLNQQVAATNAGQQPVNQRRMREAVLRSVESRGGVPAMVVENYETSSPLISGGRSKRLMKLMLNSEELDRFKQEQRLQAGAADKTVPKSASSRLDDVHFYGRLTESDNLDEGHDIARQFPTADSDKNSESFSDKRNESKNVVNFDEGSESPKQGSTVVNNNNNNNNERKNEQGGEISLKRSTTTTTTLSGDNNNEIENHNHRKNYEIPRQVWKLASFQKKQAATPLRFTPLSISESSIEGGQIEGNNPRIQQAASAAAQHGQRKPSEVNMKQGQNLAPDSSVDERDSKVSRSSLSMADDKSRQEQRMADRVANLMDRLKLYTTREQLMKVARELEAIEPAQNHHLASSRSILSHQIGKTERDWRLIPEMLENELESSDNILNEHDKEKSSNSESIVERAEPAEWRLAMARRRVPGPVQFDEILGQTTDSSELDESLQTADSASQVESTDGASRDERDENDKAHEESDAKRVLEDFRQRQTALVERLIRDPVEPSRHVESSLEGVEPEPEGKKFSEEDESSSSEPTVAEEESQASGISTKVDELNNNNNNKSNDEEDDNSDEYTNNRDLIQVFQNNERLYGNSNQVTTAPVDEPQTNDSATGSYRPLEGNVSKAEEEIRAMEQIIDELVRRERRAEKARKQNESRKEPVVAQEAASLEGKSSQEGEVAA